MKKETENSETYLKSVLNNNNGFKTPKNYFSEFDTSIATKIFEEQLPKNTGLTISNDYFKDIEGNILSSTTLQKENKAKAIQLRKLQPWLSIAAILIISLCVSIYYNVNKTETITFDNIAQSDIENWMNNNPDVITSIELETVLTDGNLGETNFDFTEISSDAIEDYLLNENDIDIYNEI